MKKTLWAMSAAVAVCVGPSAAFAQFPGGRNPGLPLNGGFGPTPRGVTGMPGVPFPTQQRDDDRLHYSHYVHHLLHAGHAPAPHGEARFVAPEAKFPVPEAAVHPAGFRSVPPVSEFSSGWRASGSVFSGLSRSGKWVFTGLGGALAAAFGGLFGRRKD